LKYQVYENTVTKLKSRLEDEIWMRCSTYDHTSTRIQLLTSSLT
jgi:hypothetical protein